ncbi:bifunctional 4-hydroxy-2-oxoglutarate aldolase/2-dehydro-3-deoxy-phosphogluconate aldolase [Georgenia alba]|uniref:2-dehydro-3-deoxy-phosphogluconate aldolase n=1 Tax=Georgenia alba TaxID=2233858 RepID=A0ABW2Q6J8_9MICO
MTAPTHDALLDRLHDLRLLPVVVLQDADQAVPLARALVAGGLPVAEVTFRTAAAADSIRAMAEAGLTAPDGTPMLIGAGTVVSPEQVDQAVSAGASFVVSPGLSAAVVERCQEQGVLVLPGTATASEIQAALALGLRAVKFFPAGVAGGPAALKALSASFPQMRFVPTGGVSEANLGEYLAVPSVLAAGGSWMVPADVVAAGDGATIERLTASAVAAAREARP